MEILLERVIDTPLPNTFRVSFQNSTERFLLPYPEVTGLIFCDSEGKQVAEWRTRSLCIAPQDDFVLKPGVRIAFDIHANINADSECMSWVIEIPPGKYSVHYRFQVARDTDWYDFLQKRSRFVDITPIWQGEMRSNSIDFEVSKSG